MRLFILQMGLDLVIQEQVCILNHIISNQLYHLGIMLLSFRQKCMLYAFAYYIYVTEVNASIAICSDSQAALKALAADKTTSQLVLETTKALTELSIHNCVRLLWVLGHSDIVGNEEADKLAKQAAAAEYIGPELVMDDSRIRNRKSRFFLEI